MMTIMNNFIFNMKMLNCGILGSVGDPESVAWLLDKIFGYVKVLGPFIVILMSGVELCKVIVTGDADGLKKAQSKLITRLILAGALFFLPTLIMAVLDLAGITSDATCVLN